MTVRHIALACWVGVILYMVIGTLIRWLKWKRKSKRCKSKALGTITSSQRCYEMEHRGSDPNYREYFNKYTLEYNVLGTTYTYTNEDQADKPRFKTGKQLTIYYNADNPAESVCYEFEGNLYYLIGAISVVLMSIIGSVCFLLIG